MLTITQNVEFERVLAYHTAPALLGVKCSNLVSLKQSEVDLLEYTAMFNARVVSKGLRLKILCKCNDRVLIILYNERMLQRQLMSAESKRLLQEYGYGQNFSVETALQHLAERIECCKQFPHEIGVFLGYPHEDVLGFIQNRGENYNFCGYWKVYGNVDKAKRTFQRYDECRTYLCNRLNQGLDLCQALESY
jgi:hypothetical protein